MCDCEHLTRAAVITCCPSSVLSSVSVLSYCGLIHARHPSRNQACNNRGLVGKRLNHACNVPVQTPCFLATFSVRPGLTATLTNLLNVVAIVLLPSTRKVTVIWWSVLHH